MARASRAITAVALAMSMSGCSFDFDSVCRTGEVCGEITVEPPTTAEPDVGQGPTCDLVRARCGPDDDRQACVFRITGNAVDEPPECRTSLGSSSDGYPCSDATFCGSGLTCYRASPDLTGTCVDLCRTVADCEGVSKTCDRSAPLVTLGGVPFYRCIETSD